MPKWWGYLHIGGRLYLKPFSGAGETDRSKLYLPSNEGVEEVYGPFKANTEDEAKETLRRLAREDGKGMREVVK